MKPNDFIAKWRNGGDERRDAQPFFEDLCRMLGQKTPKEADPAHIWFTYEYGASKTTGGNGWADVWRKGRFGWEAKGTHKDLDKAYQQLKMYADALQNPPLLIVSDLQQIIIHTNFTNSIKTTHIIRVEELEDHKKRDLLHAAFDNPDLLKPGVTRQAITEDAAKKFATLAERLRERHHKALEVAQFLNRLLFCMFAEEPSIGLLPKQLFTELVRNTKDDPAMFTKNIQDLFAAMNTKGGGNVAFKKIAWFNGGLFNDNKSLPLIREELAILLEACDLDWSDIDPSIFGTLFERGLDPNKRSQLGAHYTDPATIMKIVGPVIVDPWAKKWQETKATIAGLMARADLFGPTAKTAAEKAQRTKAANEALNRLIAFLDELRHYTVLDPACGSGNFLYLSLRALKDIEHTAIVEAEALGLARQFPSVGPANVKGIELNEYAAELARITIWIGEIQWMIQKGYGAHQDPILRPLEQIKHGNALITSAGMQADWPQVDAIVGNPPFIGGRKMKGELGAESKLVKDLYGRNVPKSSDFVCYWFEKARRAMVMGHLKRCGLVATNSIAGGVNRKVLDAILEHAPIFHAWRDEPWVNEGAAVRVSMVCFGRGDDAVMLDGKPAATISSSLMDLASGDDVAKAGALPSNANLAFQGVTPRGELQRKKREALGLPDASFVLAGPQARVILAGPPTIHGHPMSDVVRPYWVADDITGRPMDRYIVNFGTRTEEEAAYYEAPYAAIETVKQHRAHMDDAKDHPWWQLWRWRPSMLETISKLPRFISIPRVSKHHVCVWTEPSVTPGDATVVVASDQDAVLGILQSEIHKVWAIRQGTRLGVGNDPRYTSKSCFETFPFPDGMEPNQDPAAWAADRKAQRIAKAACDLTTDRDAWIDQAGMVQVQPPAAPGYPSRMVALPGMEKELAARTMTNLYNKPPVWLTKRHAALDEAVADAYGWTWPMAKDDILQKLFELNQTRVGV